jgi:hypothetical protein
MDVRMCVQGRAAGLFPLRYSGWGMQLIPPDARPGATGPMKQALLVVCVGRL